MAGSDLFTGTLDIVILKAVTWGPHHGYAIGRWIRETNRARSTTSSTNHSRVVASA
jgi:hypothetical protein